jgi:hypothetical protein
MKKEKNREATFTFNLPHNQPNNNNNNNSSSSSNLSLSQIINDIPLDNF